MEIFINDKKNLLHRGAISKAESRANASFSKYGYDVKSVEISVQDANGPRGGIDKVCRVLMRLRKKGDVSVTVKDRSLSKAINNAIQRAARSVGRTLDRRVSRDSNRQETADMEAQLVSRSLTNTGYRSTIDDNRLTTTTKPKSRVNQSNSHGAFFVNRQNNAPGHWIGLLHPVRRTH